MRLPRRSSRRRTHVLPMRSANGGGPWSRRHVRHVEEPMTRTSQRLLLLALPLVVAARRVRRR